MKANRITELKNDTIRFLRINVFIFFLFGIMIACTSCSSEDTNYVDPEEVWQTPLSQSLLGSYTHHLGESNKGTVIVGEQTVLINTLQYNIELDLKSDNNNFSFAPDCYIEAALSDRSILKISFFPDIERLDIHVTDTKGVVSYYGTFDKI